MTTFDIQPYVGAFPIEFGMKRRTVHALLGRPRDTTKVGLSPILFEYYPNQTFNIGYDGKGRVVHVGFWPGRVRLEVCGRQLWSPRRQPDPNIRLLKLDPTPIAYAGFLIYRKLGVITTGFYENDPNQHAVTIFPRSEWDDRLADALANAIKPDLSKYQRRTK